MGERLQAIFVSGRARSYERQDFSPMRTFSNIVVRELTLRLLSLDIVRVQDVGLSGLDDPDVLEWAAGADRILLTHDISTMAGYAYRRVREGRPIPGLVEVPESLPIGRVLHDTDHLATLGSDEFGSQVRFLPLRPII